MIAIVLQNAKLNPPMQHCGWPLNGACGRCVCSRQGAKSVYVLGMRGDGIGSGGRGTSRRGSASRGTGGHPLFMDVSDVVADAHQEPGLPSGVGVLRGPGLAPHTVRAGQRRRPRGARRESVATSRREARARGKEGSGSTSRDAPHSGVGGCGEAPLPHTRHGKAWRGQDVSRGKESQSRQGACDRRVRGDRREGRREGGRRIGYCSRDGRRGGATDDAGSTTDNCDGDCGDV